MLPKINGKSFLECTEEDLKLILNNPDYKENQYIEYKKTFSFLEAKTSSEKAKCVAEFRSDICSFANSEGGYLLYGVSEAKGMANELTGVEITDSDTDKFELNRKNNLMTLQPKIPSIKFGFIALENGNYVVVILVRNDGYTPYVHVENEKDYRIYKRSGNRKMYIGYLELKNMFNQSLSLDKEILSYRQERIMYFRSNEDTEDFRYSKFLLFHIIPDTFTDSSYNQSMFLLQKKNSSLPFTTIFYDIGCNDRSRPNVDGLKFLEYGGSNECQLNNNGIAECFCPVYSKMFNGIFCSQYFYEKLESVIQNYINVMKDKLGTKRVFLCVSVLGCKNMVSENNFNRNYKGVIDRDTILCSPIVIENTDDIAEVDRAIKCFKLEFILSLGIKVSGKLNELVNEILESE